ncbi:MAG TPA: molybdate ABC transporter substrate-binding protein [Burkholderiaceae bacterium]|nr:molybdate ABC transporter substrate-binding protein [Burkholderiaceae bacterium]
MTTRTAKHRVSRRRVAALLAAALTAASGWTAPAALAQPAPVIAAASDLKFALDEIADQFSARTGQRVRISYGSSGNFFRQIQQGAPFELFLSADEAFVFELARSGHAIDDGIQYAIGRIVLFSPRGSPVAPDAQMDDLRAAIGDGRLKRFAIANPEHAPYGRAAREALQHRQLWDAVAPMLVLGENVSQAAQFAASGSAQAGIFALSLALAPAFAGAGQHVLIPEQWHEPLRQRMALTRRATPTARAFYDHLGSADARRVFVRYGFTLPGE